MECNTIDNLVFVNTISNRLSLLLLVMGLHMIRVRYRSLECRDGLIIGGLQKSCDCHSK